MSSPPVISARPGDAPGPGSTGLEGRNLFAETGQCFADCPGDTLVIRPNTGVSGDIIVTGLLLMAGLGQEDLDGLMDQLGLGNLAGRVTLESRSVNSVQGHGLKVDLPHEHSHRHLKEVETFFEAGALGPEARLFALETFRLLAEAESQVHELPPEEVHFHEVGALDSLIDIGLAALLMEKLPLTRIWCGPLPLCDGVIQSQHGLLPSPAPAVLKLLRGVPAYGLDSAGETVTPTGLALLKAMKVRFGSWPPMVIERQALVYGARVFPNVPNGAIFLLGRRQDAPAPGRPLF